jgi:ribosomal protein S18 acetylase RimI-like enzyme
MDLVWSDSLDGVNWRELSDLYRVAPLGDKPPEALKTAFANSLYRWFVSDAGRLVGAGRALADGADCSYICDVAVLPSHQGQGLGKAIISRLVEQSQDHRKIILYAAQGKEPIYAKLGFRRMKTAMAMFKDTGEAVRRGLVEEG